MIVDELLQKAWQAVEKQSWNEAWGFLGQIDNAEIGSKEEELLLCCATTRRQQGHVETAKQLYLQLKNKLTLQDAMLADVIMGLAWCERIQNNPKKAALMAQSARYIFHQSHEDQVRLAASEAYIRSYVNIEQSLELFDFLFQHFPAQTNSLWSGIYFQYATTLFKAGDFNKSLPHMLRALEMSQSTQSLVYFADCLRKLPLLRALLGQKDYALKGIMDLHNAKSLYDLSGDKGYAYLLTEQAEVYRSLGKYREAVKCYDQGAWAAKNLGEKAWLGHNLLGSFELSRVMGITLKWKHLEDALETYESINHQWGILHAMIARFMADSKGRSKLFDTIMNFIETSSYSTFAWEAKTMKSFLEMTPKQIDSYPHIMNFA